MTVALALAALIGCFLLIQPGQFVDPVIFGDDLAWEVDPAFYGVKLRQEGRWLVFGWMSAFGHGSAAFDYMLMIALWCATTLVVARSALGELRHPMVLLFAIALALSPSLWALTLWPHTTLPMSAMLFIGALGIARAAGARSGLRALFAAMLATVLSYQLFSFYLLGAVLVAVVLNAAASGPSSSPTRLAARSAAVVGVGVAGMVGGLLVQYGLNALAFGHFGLEEAAWRSNEAAALGTSGRPALALAILKANLAWLDHHTSERLLPIGLLGLIALVFAVRGRDSAQVRVVAIGAMILAAVSLAPLLIPIATGVVLPVDRGCLNLWLGLVGWLALPLAVSTSKLPRLLASGGLALLLVGTFQSLSTASATRAADWRQNQLVLDQLSTAVRATGIPEPRIIVVGTPQLFDGLAGGAHWFAAMLIKHRLGGSAKSLSFCQTFQACPRSPFTDADIASMPIFPAPSAVRRRDGMLLVKVGPTAA
jgi:hypothetical protein